MPNIRFSGIVDSVVGDLRFAVRQLRKSPVVSCVVMLILALGMGANTAVFSVVNAWLLRPLPLKDPQQLVAIWRTRAAAPREPAFFDLYHDYVVWARSNRTFQSLAATFDESYALTGAGEPQQIHGGIATWNLFATVGASAQVGRLFLPEDVDGGAVCVISHALWVSHFGASSAIIGRSIALNGKPYRVLGVLPAGFSLRVLDRSFDDEVWTLIHSGDPGHTPTSPSPVAVVGRLRSGVTAAQAEADLTGVQRQLDRMFSDYPPGFGVLVTGLQQDNTRTLRASLLLLFAAVLVLLVIACVNAGGLIVGRNSGRSAEFALRLALGCSRRRLWQQLTIEVAVLFAAGAAAGLLGALALLRAFAALNPFGVLPAGGVSIDAAVLALTAVAALTTAWLFGSWPAARALRRLDLEALRSRATAGRVQLRARVAFVTAEFALSVVLLVCAGLLISTFARIGAEPLGFRTSDVFVSDVALPYRVYPTKSAEISFAQQAVTRIRELPGIESVGIAISYPFQVEALNPFDVEGHSADTAEHLPSAAWFVVAPGYFDALGVPLLRGRAFTDDDRRDTPAVAVISNEAARLLFPGADPIGKRLRLHHDKTAADPWLTVVGVVGTTSSVRYNQISWDRYPEVYTALYQQPEPAKTARGFSSRSLYLYLRGRPQQSALAAAVHQIDPDLPVSALRSTSDIVGSLRAQPRLRALLFGGFGLLALALAAVGVYGVMAQMVEQRRREIGIRMALGAQRSNIIGMLLANAMRLFTGGLLLGVAGAFIAARFLRSFLYGVSALDPLAYGAALATLAAIALLASCVPARQAASVDPSITLRAE